MCVLSRKEQNSENTTPFGITSHELLWKSLVTYHKCVCVLQITHRETIAQINELTGAAITIRGRFYDKGEKIPDDDRKLYLLIEGPTQAKVKAAKDECKAIIADMTEKALRRDQGAQGPGKYNVM